MLILFNPAGSRAVRLVVSVVMMAPFLVPVAGAPAGGRDGRDAAVPRARAGGAVACDQGSGEDGAGRRADAAGNHATCVMAFHADRREAHSQQAGPWLPRPAGRRPGGPEGPGHKQKEKTMIFHINQMAFKAGLSEEQCRACLDAARQAGEAHPAV